MKIEFAEPIHLGLRKSLDGRVVEHRRFEEGDFLEVEFLGEGHDLETIDFRLPDGSFAIEVPRLAVSVFNQKPDGQNGSGTVAGAKKTGGLLRARKGRRRNPGAF